MDTQYAILRTEKLKSATSMRGSLKHAFRAQNTPNADPERTPQNEHFGAFSVDEAMKNFRDRLAKVDGKIRSNAVLGIEYLVTGSPEAMAGMNKQQQDAYFTDAFNWLSEKHGQENIVYAGVHRDETTPHMYAYVVPLEERENKAGEKIQKLNARGYLGGSKHVLSEMQTDFAESVGKNHGLERGVKGSRAKHQTIGAFYGKLDESFKEKTMPVERKVVKKTLWSVTEQSDENFARDVAHHVRTKEGPTRAQVEAAKREKRQAKQTVKALDRQLERVGDPRDLDNEHAAKLARETERIRQEQKEERESKFLERKRERGRDRGR